MKAADITTDHGVVNNYGNITAKNISITTYSAISPAKISNLQTNGTLAQSSSGRIVGNQRHYRPLATGL
ncbi:hypothetical protein A7K92_21500 [Klebsiella pneumoniae]|nr:hypothetical protein A7K92_21500 [Klebsiella pneumoniae]